MRRRRNLLVEIIKNVNKQAESQLKRCFAAQTEAARARTVSLNNL
jgi:hypothetical protein